MSIKIFDIIKHRIRKEKFSPTSFGLLFNPSYIIRRELYKNIRDIAPEIYGDVLDFGCGSKPYRELFFHSSSYVGLDLEISGHDHKDSDIDVCYDGETFPFPDHSFDAVVSFEVFEHVFNINKTISEIARILKYDGKLLITIPFVWGEHEIPFDFARYTSFGIKHILENNGFSIDRILKINRSFKAIGQLFIGYVFDNICPNNSLLSAMFRVGVVFPLNVITISLDRILPDSDSYYTNLVILASRAEIAPPSENRRQQRRSASPTPLQMSKYGLGSTE